jgi:hypothetical protein
VAQWCNGNNTKIKFSNSMRIGSIRKLQNVNCELNIFYEEKLLQEVTCEKLLGINIRQLFVMDSTYK